MKLRLTSAVLFAMSFGWGCFAQDLHPLPATADDYISLLQKSGYDAYAFDIADLADKRHKITFQIREYDNGQLVSSNILPWEPTYDNIRYVTDFSEEARADVDPEKMADPERGIYSMARRLKIGFVPEADSVKTVEMTVENMGSAYGRLNLKPQTVRETGKKFYAYVTRPFTTGKIGYGDFTPLVLIGSVWWDEQFGVHRFCGENEISPDLSSDIVAHIPHFYVIGACIKAANNDK